MNGKIKEHWVAQMNIREFQAPSHSFRIYMADDTDKEVEQLKKEKEWLVENLMGTWQQDIPDTDDDELRAFILKSMQQALKEGE